MKTKRAISLGLMLTFIFTSTISAYPIKAYAKEYDGHVGIIEEGEDYTIYFNEDGSRTVVFELDIASQTPQKEGVVASNMGEYEYESKDDTAKVLFDADVEAGDAVAAILSEDDTLKLIPVSGEDIDESRQESDDESDGEIINPETKIDEKQVNEKEIENSEPRDDAETLNREEEQSGISEKENIDEALQAQNSIEKEAPDKEVPDTQVKEETSERIDSPEEVQNEESDAKDMETSDQAQDAVGENGQKDTDDQEIEPANDTTASENTEREDNLNQPNTSKQSDEELSEPAPVPDKAQGVEDEEVISDRDEADEKTKVAQGLGTLKNYSYTDRSFEKVLYTDMFGDDIDVEYIPITGGFKENIIIKSPTQIDQFQYGLTFEGLIAQQFENTILIVDKYEDLKYMIEAPYMEDAVGAKSYDVELKLKENMSDGRCTFYVVPNHEWLNAAERVYPITIDPTVTLNDANKIEDKTIKESSPSSIEDYRSSRIRTGGARGYRQHTYIKPDMSWMGSRVLIQSAQLNLTRINSGSVGTSSGETVMLFESLGNWNVQTITWNNKPGAGSALSSTNVYGNGSYHLDATAYAQSCFSGGSYIGNKGFVLASYSGAGYKEYGSSDSTSSRLTFTVTYSNMLTSVPAPTVTARSKGTSTGKGYIDVSWDAISGADQYYVAIFNGDEYELINAGNSTSWSSEGKGIWPTQAQIDSGEYHLNTSGGGEDLDTVPMPVYTNAGGSYGDDNRYFVKIIPYSGSVALAAPAVCLTTSVVLPDALGPSAPTLSMVPSDYTNLTTALLSWNGIVDYNGSDFVTDNLSKIEYAIDTQSTWIDTGITEAEHNNFSIDSSVFGDGSHPIYVRATDLSGNIGDIAVSYINVDRTGPDSPDMTTVSDWVNTNILNIDWASISDPRGLDRLEYRFDSEATWISTGENTSPFNDYPLDISGLDDGVHQMELRGVDNCGNTGDAVSTNIKVDRTDPYLLGLLTNNANTWSNTDAVSLSWGGADDISSGVDSILYNIDGGAWQVLGGSDTNTVIDWTSRSDGQFDVWLNVTDVAGNAIEKSSTVKIDRTAPTNMILDPANGDAVTGTLNVWGSSKDVNLKNTTLTVTRYDNLGSYIDTYEIFSNAKTYSSELLGSLDISAFDAGDQLRLNLDTSDEADNITTTYVNISVDADTVPVAQTLTIDEPSRNGNVDQVDQRIHYVRDSGASGSVTEQYLFVDDRLVDTETASHSLYFESLLYDEQSVHNITAIAKNSNGDLEYAQGMASHRVLSAVFTNGENISALEHIDFTSSGAAISAGETSGYFVINAFDFSDSDMAYVFDLLKEEPTGTSVNVQVSFDHGTTWQTINLAVDRILETSQRTAMVKVTLNGTSTTSPVVKSLDVDAVKSVDKYMVKVQLLNAPTNLSVSENVDKHIKITWDVHTDSDIKYNIHRDTAPGFTPNLSNRLAGGISDAFYEDTNITAGTRYYYQVIAVKDYGVSLPYVSNRSSQAADLTVTAFKEQSESASNSNKTTTTTGDGQDNALNDSEWGDADEISDAENANSIYGGNYTVNHDEEPPQGDMEMNESMLGLRDVCASGFEPINFNTGNFYIETTDADYSAMPGMPSDISRVYNVQSDENDGPFGNGWAFDYSIHLKIYSNGDVGMINTDGHMSMFRLNTNGVYVTDASERQTLTIKDGHYIVTDAEETQYIFTSGGLLDQIKNTNGNTQTLTYDENGLLKRIKLSSDKTIDFITNAEGHITQIELPGGVALHYTYEDSLLTGFIDAAGNETKYTYDNQGRMIEWMDASGVRQVKNIYDNQDRVVEQWDGANSYYQLTYGDGFTSTTDAQGVINTFYFDDLGRSTKMVDGDGKSQEFEYNAYNLVTKYTDETGKFIYYTYDDKGNLTKETHKDGRTRSYMYDEDSNLTAKSDYMGNWTTFEYDDSGNMTKQINPDGGTYIYHYNRYNQLIKESGPLGYEVRYSYNGAEVSKITNANGEVTRQRYDDLGNLVKTTDAEGNVTRMDYDELGHVIQTTMADGTTLRFKYDDVDNVTAVYDAYGKATRYTYDALRQLIKVTNPDGSETNYAYDKKGNLTTVINADGSTTQNVYDDKSNLIETIDDTGAKTKFYYNVSGDLVATADANGGFSYFGYDQYTGWLAYSVNADWGETSYVYDNNGNVLKTTYPDGSITAYTYDEMGRKTATTYPDGTQTNYEYDALGRLIRETNPKGNETTYGYDKVGNLVSITDALGNTSAYIYDSLGNMTRTKDALGNITTYVYDSVGQLKQVTYPLGGTEQYEYDLNGQIDAIINVLGSTSSNTYDSMGRVVEVTDPLGGIETYAYDVMGNVTQTMNAKNAEMNFEYDALGEVTRITDASGASVTYTYDAIGNVKTVNGEEGFSQEYTYDRMGRVTSVLDSEGHETTYSYDEMSRVLTESGNGRLKARYIYDILGQVKETENGEGEKTKFRYDENGNLIKVIYADGTNQAYVYDALDQVISETDRQGHMTRYTYDALGNITKVTLSDGRETTYSYDAENNLVREMAPDGSKTAYTYDEAGNLLTTTDSLGNTTRMVYNEAGLLTQVVDALDEIVLMVEYDILGNVITETDGLSNTTTYDYDALNRLTAVTDPLGYTTQYIYDMADNLVGVIDANGNQTSYAYNTLGALTSETDALGNTESYLYQKDGLLAEIINPDGTSQAYTYDNADRMTRIDYSDGSVTKFGYNETGAVTTMTDDMGISTYQYDENSRLVSYTDTNDKTVAYAYDTIGRRIKTTLPDGQETRYMYDNMNRVAEVIGEDGTLAEYTYDENGQLTQDMRAGITTNFEYDALGQIVSLKTFDSDDLLESYRYTYDINGNALTERRETQESVTHRSYSYDANQQLTHLSEESHSEAYTYDAVGNITKQVMDGERTAYTYNEANQLTKETQSGHTTTYAYNPNGDITKASSGETYTYDSQGNLTGILGNGINQTFTYDGSGNRTSKTVDGETITYVNDINLSYTQVLQTYDEDDNAVNTYTYGVRRIQSQGKDNEVYLYDGRGSVSGVSGEDGSITSYAYTAYGDLLLSSPTPNVYGYNAEDTDDATGLQYLRARYYNTKQARFIQQDEYKGDFSQPQTLNRYAYCQGNPIKYSDPSGYVTQSQLRYWLSGYEALDSAVYTAMHSARSLGKQKTAAKQARDKAYQDYKTALNAYNNAIIKTRSKKKNKQDAQDAYVSRIAEYNGYAQLYNQAYQDFTDAQAERRDFSETYFAKNGLSDYWTAKDVLQQLENEVASGATPADTADDRLTLLCLSDERQAIYKRMANMSQYKGEDSEAVKILLKVLQSEETRDMSTGELMVQFALQFTGKEDKFRGDDIDKLDDIERSGQLPYDTSSGNSLDDYEDCSGFVQQMYSIFFDRGLGKNGETSGHDDTQYTYSRDFSLKRGEVKAGKLSIGDLIYYDLTGSTNHVSHVAMFIGNGHIIEELESGEGVVMSLYSDKASKSIGMTKLNNY